jgi:hypothetical protein
MMLLLLCQLPLPLFNGRSNLQRYFFPVVVVEGPSFPFFFQRTVQDVAFWLLRLVWVAGWLWRLPQAEKKFDRC